MVRQHIRTNPAYASEVARQYALAKKVSETDPFEPPVAQSWKSLCARIDEAKSPGGQVQNLPRRLPIFHGLHLLTGILIAVGSGVSLMLFPPMINGAHKSAVHSVNKETAITFRAEPDLPPERLAAILNKYNLALSNGPTPSGNYTASPIANTDANIAYRALMTSPEIVSATRTKAQ